MHNRSNDRPIIGIVGGLGPHAGYDLALKILRETDAGSDQEHIPVALISDNDAIVDRTSFLFGQTTVNPGHAISAVLRKLEDAGATVAGIPCNTAHAFPVWKIIEAEQRARGSSLRIVNMIQEVGEHIRKEMTGVRRVGLLSTLGTARSDVYREILAENDIDVILPREDIRENVHAAANDPSYGIKALSQPVSERARRSLEEALESLRAEGLRAVILGCTEIPLAFPEMGWKDVDLIDPTRVLARALIKETYPEKLKLLR